MQVELKIDGMTCGGCVRSVETALKRMPDVRDVSIDLAAGRATVETDADAAALIAAVEDAGYDARIADRP